jgi:hypothetical protein
MLFHKLFKPADAAPAGIQLVGAKTASGFTSAASSVSLTDLTGGIASAPAVGDLVAVYLGTGGSSNPTPAVTTGYTTIADLYASDTYDDNLFVAYKILTAADTTVTLDGNTARASGSWTAYISVWRNVDATYPFDVAPQTNTIINTIYANPPAITPITTGSYIIAGGSGAHAESQRTYSSSNLTGFRSVGINASTTDSTIGGGYEAWVSGAFDPAAFTFSGGTSTSYSTASATLALRPTGKTLPSFITSSGVYFVGNSGTITVPAHQAGDLIVFVNSITGSTTAPSLTSGFTNITTFNNIGSGWSRAARAQYIFSDGTITSLSCATNGSIAIFRNATTVTNAKTVSTAAASGVTSVSVSSNAPTVAGAIYILAGYAGTLLSSTTGLTEAVEFGGYSRVGATYSVVSGTLSMSGNVAPCYFGVEIY